MTEEELIRRLREYARISTRNINWHPDREDWIQEAVVAGWREWEKDPERAPGYYFRAAMNRLLTVKVKCGATLGHPGRHRWQRGLKQPRDIAPLEPGCEDENTRLQCEDRYPSDTAHIRAALAGVTGAPAQVIRLLDSGLTKGEAARTLGMSPSWVSKQLGIAREQLTAAGVAA